MTAATKLTIIVGIFITVLVGWAVDGYGGAAVGLVIGVAVGVVRWRGQPLWSWLISWLRRRRPIRWSEPLTVANDRAGGGVRYQDGVAVAAVHCSANHTRRPCSPGRHRPIPKTPLTSPI